MINLRYFLAFVALLTLPLTCISQVGTDVESLSGDCQVELNQLLSNYTNPIYSFDSCDTACQQACGQTLQDAIYADKSSECPLQENITSCFAVRQNSVSQIVSKYELNGRITAMQGAKIRFIGHTIRLLCSIRHLQLYAPQWQMYASECNLFNFPETDASGNIIASHASGGEAGRRRLLDNGESSAGPSGPVGSGCFPVFDTSEEFETYIKGDYW